MSCKGLTQTSGFCQAATPLVTFSAAVASISFPLSYLTLGVGLGWVALYEGDLLCSRGGGWLLVLHMMAEGAAHMACAAGELGCLCYKSSEEGE